MTSWGVKRRGVCQTRSGKLAFSSSFASPQFFQLQNNDRWQVKFITPPLFAVMSVNINVLGLGNAEPCLPIFGGGTRRCSRLLPHAMMGPMRLVYMGSPEFAVLPLRYLVEEGHNVLAVYTKMDKPAGRGHVLSISPVKREALALGLTVVQPKNLKDDEVQSELGLFRPEAIIVCAYGQILPAAVLALPKYGCLNIHPSLLPRHRGAAPVTATILAGDEWGGTSVMLMDEGLDTGPVLTRALVRVRTDDTTGLLTARLAPVSARLLLDVLPRWVKGGLALQAQDKAQATYFKMMAKEAGEIDWTRPAAEIERRVRAFQPWPAAYTHFQGRLLKVLSSRVVLGEADMTPGKVAAIGKGFGVATGAGVLEVLGVQLEGRQAVSGADFLRGQRDFADIVLPT